ncbi:MAG TPA: ATP-binding protein [Mariniphaga sp.]|nr:ATP-binding protein [Mariniphaga sp.]
MKHSIDIHSLYTELKPLDTLEWSDLIITKEVVDVLDKFSNWLIERKKHNSGEIPGTESFNGLRAIFYGPAGTGKKSAVNILGNVTGYRIFRINISHVFSKYIGETEKNLSRLFKAAEESNAILFFDEADALFGKRTEVKDSHDKYANQKLSLLFRLISSTSAVVIMVFNNQLNLDFLFFKHFDVKLEFKFPDAYHRLLLWKKYLPLSGILEEEINIDDLALRYELTGGSIVNAINNAFENQPESVNKDNLLDAVRKEIAIQNVRLQH